MFSIGYFLEDVESAVKDFTAVLRCICCNDIKVGFFKKLGANEKLLNRVAALKGTCDFTYAFDEC